MDTGYQKIVRWSTNMEGYIKMEERDIMKLYSRVHLEIIQLATKLLSEVLANEPTLLKPVVIITTALRQCADDIELDDLTPAEREERNKIMTTIAKYREAEARHYE